MNSLLDHFETDWQAMTTNDWIGTVLTVVIFLLMILAYFQVFRPKNRERLEAKKHIPFDEDELDQD
ncbi:cbb3-type cytochrome c oxidase subunit 3 [Thiocystis violacea]|uniref:cbb3-type cytochrome c oxidase subunit 3 n=1 Tax=Thiocystis violacea TaxID=13725 RepID=UPI0019034506|nr:CcoQ/FixQ family Cbb3-type cytochrome c oxidase assembly chaperone [Thiocystis violacea]